MKIRTGFVSNSSSSSFICDITGDAEAGMDMSLEDARMCNCKNGHTFYDHYYKGTKNLSDEVGKYEEPYRDGVDQADCPLCTRTHINNNEIIGYLAANNILNLDDIKTKMKQEIKDIHPEWFV